MAKESGTISDFFSAKVCKKEFIYFKVLTSKGHTIFWWLNFLYKQIFELEKIDRQLGIEPGSLDYMPSVIPLDHRPSLLLEAH